MDGSTARTTDDHQTSRLDGIGVGTRTTSHVRSAHGSSDVIGVGDAYQRKIADADRVLGDSSKTAARCTKQRIFPRKVVVAYGLREVLVLPDDYIEEAKRSSHNVEAA